MNHIPFIRPLQPSRRIDQYAMSVRPLQRTDVYPKLLKLFTDPNDPCLGIDESQPPSSSEGQLTNNAETDTGVSTYQSHNDSVAYVIETVRDQSVSYHGSTRSNNLSLKHNTQETSVECGPYRYLWGPQDWLTHLTLYDKYMERYLHMPLEFVVDYATSLPSLGPSYGAVSDVVSDLAMIVEQIEYYFSFDNLIHDVNFREHMNYYEGWVSLLFVASLPEVRELTLNVKVIEEAVRASFAIEIKDVTKLIRHRHSWQRWISPCEAMN